MPSPPRPAPPPALPAPPRPPTPPNSPPSSPPYFLTDADLAEALPGQLSLIQLMPHLLTAAALTTARKAAYRSLSCDVGQACNSTVLEVQTAILRATLALGLLNMDALNQLLPADAWGVTVQSSCVDGGVRLVLPEPVVRLDGSAPTAALLHPTLNGDAVVLNATTLAGPWQSGGISVYVLELGAELLPSGGKLLVLSIEEGTLVAPLRGLMPRMTLSTTLANCYAPSIVSVSSLPVNASGNLAQEGWDAAVRATVGLQIVFSEGVASRAQDGTLSPLDVASFHIETPNGTEVLEVRMSTSTGARRGRRRLLDAEAYVSEAVVLLGIPAAPGAGDSVGFSVLEGRVVDQQGNAMVGGRIVWANLEPPGLPTSPGCPWLGGMMASALMASLSLLELSRRLLPEKVCICRWRRGTSRKSKYISPEPAPAVSLPPETLPSSPPPSPPAASLGNRTRTIVKLEEGTGLFHRRPRIGRASFATVEVLSAASEAAVSNKPKLGRVVWMMSLVGSAFLFAWGGARQLMYAYMLPVWFAQWFLLFAQCGKRQSGRALLPALRTLGVCVMSIAVAFVTAFPNTDLSPLRRLVIVGPTALVAALFIAIDAVTSRRTVKKQTASREEKPAGMHWSSESGSSEFGSTRPSSIKRDLDNEARDALHKATRAVWTIAARETACKCRGVAAFAQKGSTSSLSSSLSSSSPSSSCHKSTCSYQPPPPLLHEPSNIHRSSRRLYSSSADAPSCLQAGSAELVVSSPHENSVSPPPSPPSYIKRQEQRLGLQLLWTRQARVVLPSPRPLCRSRSVALLRELGFRVLRELGAEALGSLALLIAVLMTVVGVPPYGVGDHTCHSAPVSVCGTITTLIAPLSLGLLRRVRWQDIEQGVENSSSKVVYEGSDQLSSRRSSEAVREWRDRRSRSSRREAVNEWHRESIIGKKPPDAPAESPTAEMLLRELVGQAGQAKWSIAAAESMLPVAEEPATPAVWVELAAAVTGPDSGELQVSRGGDELLLMRVRKVLEAAEAQMIQTEPAKPKLPPDVAAALVGEAWRRWPSKVLYYMPAGPVEQIKLLRSLINEERHEGAAAALSEGLKPQPAATTSLPHELLKALEREFERQHSTFPPSTHDTVAFLDRMLETRNQALERVGRTTAALPAPPPANLVLAARKAYWASHGAPAPTDLAALAFVWAVLPVQPRALLTAVDERARVLYQSWFQALPTGLWLSMSEIAESCDFVPKTPNGGSVAGEAARLSVLRDAIEVYVDASRACEEAQEGTRNAALPHLVLNAARAEISAQHRSSLRDLEAS